MNLFGVWVALLSALVPASVGAQDAWSLRSAPYVSPGEGGPRSRAVADFQAASRKVIGLQWLGDWYLPAGAREVRLWVSGPGPIIPSVLVRVTDFDGVALGEVVLVWEQTGEPFRGISKMVEFESLMLSAEGPAACRALQNGTRITYRNDKGDETQSRQWSAACHYRTAAPDRDWRGVLEELDRLGIHTLAEWDYEAELARTGSITRIADGVGIRVESLEGDHYHSFYWSNPDHYPGSDADAAAALITLVLDLKRELQEKAFAGR